MTALRELHRAGGEGRGPPLVTHEHVMHALERVTRARVSG